MAMAAARTMVKKRPVVPNAYVLEPPHDRERKPERVVPDERLQLAG